MTVEQLIRELSQQPQDAEVFVGYVEDGAVSDYLTIDGLSDWTEDRPDVAIYAQA